MSDLQPPAGFPIHFACGKSAGNYANGDHVSARHFNHSNCKPVAQYPFT